MVETIPLEYRGWWRITETSQWSSKFLDDLGPAMLSLTGDTDRLRMHCLLAYVNCRPTKTGVSFTWEGAWEYDQMSGSGRVTLGKDGKSITCKVCGRTSHHPEDVRYLYCGYCHAFHPDGGEGRFYLLKFEGLNNRFDFFHSFIVPTACFQPPGQPHPPKMQPVRTLDSHSGLGSTRPAPDLD
jgi:hypothetical protein